MLPWSDSNFVPRCHMATSSVPFLFLPPDLFKGGKQDFRQRLKMSLVKAEPSWASLVPGEGRGGRRFVSPLRMRRVDHSSGVAHGVTAGEFLQLCAYHCIPDRPTERHGLEQEQGIFSHLIRRSGIQDKLGRVVLARIPPKLLDVGQGCRKAWLRLECTSSVTWSQGRQDGAGCWKEASIFSQGPLHRAI